MDVTLINPDSPFLLDPKVMPNLGLLYISSYLKSRGVKVNFVDLAGEDKEIPVTGHYGITATTPQFPEAVKILKRIKSSNPDSKVLIGGPHATLMPEECVDAGFDWTIQGEGEWAIHDILKSPTSYEGYPVLATSLPDINGLPFPDRSLVKDYTYTIDGKKATTMVTSRGNCPFNCAFCSKTWKTKMRFRSVENVVEEAKELKKFNYSGIQFYDDELFINRERDFEICSRLKDLELVWRCFTRSNLVDEEMAAIASESGCKEMLIGIESGSDDILKNIDKGVTVEQDVEAVKILHRHNIRVKAAMIIGLPGESDETLKETWKFCESMKPYIADFDFTILIPYPGSPIFEHPEKYDIKFKVKDVTAPYKGGSWRSIVSTSRLSEEQITKWREKFHLKFKGEIL